MKHASLVSLHRIEPLLTELRALPGLTERKPGVFYRKSQAFAHFHEDPAGMFGDVRMADDWARFAVDTADQQASFMRTVGSRL